MKAQSVSLFDLSIIVPALGDAFKKLNPRQLIKNPVMFITAVGAVMTTVGIFTAESDRGFITHLSLWLWFTVLFANFAEAVAEGRGKAQANTLRRTRAEIQARRLIDGTREERVAATDLRKNDTIVCESGDLIPADGDVIEGIATVDESAITGESAPVIRESGGDRCAVTGGTRVLSDRIVVRITAERGQGFMDRMIALVEGASRQKTPNEIALTILLAALTLIFLLVCVTSALRHLCRRRRSDSRARGAAGLPYSHHDRRTVGRNRHHAAWTAWSNAMWSQPRAGPWRPPATSTCSCSTRPARSRWATAWPPISCRHRAFRQNASPRRPSCHRSQTPLRRAAASSCSPSRNSTCANANWLSPT
ncbi:MAG: hypothetical protein H7A44_05180 [Opitutaceae bacterium]|nr:hypothetical protein [Opitutaceae bacterium]